ncbi:hypothetical protein [Actinophytocola xanthii]|uniref:hypothetical protein n=1 Tax=Actinophytocola xanthii TaxID=1912961 RepID=UPI0009FA2608|nr:hypothetical protein [Actinophytocola xanthii]
MGKRLLRRWGIADPSPEQCHVAARHLLVRRLLWLGTFLVLAPAVGMVFGWFGEPIAVPGLFRLVMSLVAALLLAETAAAVRQIRGVRVAVLARRSWRDLVPRWPMALLLGAAALALVLAGVGLAAQPWADRVVAGLPPNGVPQPGGWTSFVSDDVRAEIGSSPGWLVVSGTVLCLAAVLGVVRLAVRRQTVADPVVDTVLRARTARVVVGAGIGLLTHLVVLANNRLSLLSSLSFGPDPLPPPGWVLVVDSASEIVVVVLFVVAGPAWVWVATPPRRAGHLARVA